jgi:hypothetical protein
MAPATADVREVAETLIISIVSLPACFKEGAQYFYQNCTRFIEEIQALYLIDIWIQLY